MSDVELRARRLALGLSVADLAREFAVLPTTVYRWEAKGGPPHGVTSVGVDTILKRLEAERRRSEQGTR